MTTLDGRDPTFRAEVVAGGPVAEVRVTGGLDAATAPGLVDVVGPLIDAGSTSVVIDCGRLSFCDSAGLRSLMLIRHRLPDDGSVTLIGADDVLRRMLDATGLQSHFDLR